MNPFPVNTEIAALTAKLNASEAANNNLVAINSNLVAQLNSLSVPTPTNVTQCLAQCSSHPLNVTVEILAGYTGIFAVLSGAMALLFNQAAIIFFFLQH